MKLNTSFQSSPLIWSERLPNVPKPIKESAPVKPRRHRARRTEIWFWCLSMWIVTLCSKPPDQIKFLKSIPVVLGKPQIHTHHCKFRHRRNAGTCPLRASPCNHSNLNISATLPELRKPPLSAWSCRSRQQHPRQQRPRNFRLWPQSQSIALSSALPAALTISKRPARSRRRPFGVPSPCGKNGQEHCRFPWDWQLRRPPASPPAAGKRARSRHPARAPAHAHARVQQPHHLSP